MKKIVRAMMVGFVAATMLSGTVASAAVSQDVIKNVYTCDDVHYVGDHDGYVEETPIDKDNVHYGWRIGHFEVTGFTQMVKDKDGNPVFLKNAGDTICLDFVLEQDINKLNGNEKLHVESDKKGQDEHFETEVIDFGKGVLLSRQTDSTNTTSLDPIKFKDFLEAKAIKDKATFIDYYEEGDYEVALDYRINDAYDWWFDKQYDYKIPFKFSVRNSDTVVYLLDTKNSSSILDKGSTQNGFRIDFGLSKYLKVYVKREKINSEGNLSVAYNKAAKDGDAFNEPGIYTITIQNIATDKQTVKKVYVGTDEIAREMVASGLSYREIEEQEASNIAKEENDNSLVLNSAQNSQGVELLYSTDDNGTEIEKKEDADEEGFSITEVEKTIKAAGIPFWLVLSGVVLFIIGEIVKKCRKPAKSKKTDKDDNEYLIEELLKEDD